MLAMNSEPLEARLCFDSHQGRASGLLNQFPNGRPDRIHSVVDAVLQIQDSRFIAKRAGYLIGSRHYDGLRGNTFSHISRSDPSGANWIRWRLDSVPKISPSRSCAILRISPRRNVVVSYRD